MVPAAILVRLGAGSSIGLTNNGKQQVAVKV